MKISVCMATYNGEKFVREQLECIWQQTCKPTEVIICDDDSTDGTREIIRDFIAEKNLEDAWKLIHNRERKGYPGNFYYCMGLATGDVVYLADQDDIWSSEKIERMQAVLERQDAIKVLACKMELVDAEGKDIKTLIKPNYSKETGMVKNISLEQVLYKNEWSGMVLAYRNQWYRQKKETIDNPKIPHDLSLCICGALEHGMHQVDCVLAWHRRHENNAAGEEHRIQKLLDKERKLADIRKYQSYLEAVLQSADENDNPELDAIRRKYEQMKRREELLTDGKAIPVIKNYRENRRDIRFFSFLCDWLICLRGK